MPALNPDHLFEQADKLMSPKGGAPRQADLRRAISNAYYGVFHATLAAAADEVVGVTNRDSQRYALVYRSVDHRPLRDLCTEVKKPSLPVKFARYEPRNGFGPNVKAFAAADYDPLIRVKLSDAIVAVTTARTALKRFRRASPLRRKSFLTLLLFSPR